MSSDGPRHPITCDLSITEYFDVERAARAAKMDPNDYTRARLLDAVRREIAVHRRANTFDCWVMCPTCGDVLHDVNLDLVTISHPAPCCQATGHRMIWPNAMSSFADVAEIEMSDERSIRAALLLQAAACEALLEETLWNILGRYEPHVDVARSLMARTQGRNAMLRLYGELAGAKPHGLMKSRGFDAWLEAWGRLVQNRNEVVHGGHAKVTDVELKRLITAVHAGAYPAFAALNNAGVKNVRARLEAARAWKSNGP